MHYKTLQRIAKAKHELTWDTQFQAAFASFVPRLTIGQKTYTGVRPLALTTSDAKAVRFLTDGGEFDLDVASLSPEARREIYNAGQAYARLTAAHQQQQMRVAEVQSAGARAAAEAERARQTAQPVHRIPARQVPQPRNQDGENVAATVGGALVAGAVLWGLYELFKGDDSSSRPDPNLAFQQQEQYRINRRDQREA
ncbi:MAG: hypothetical protein EBU88_17920, partial [Acidobacteria bacterium]|nr:hypothetical protein [Acidobacteriota bacterium]